MPEKQQKWYVLRDLKRHNSNSPGYIELRNLDFEVFTPLKWKIVIQSGKRTRKQVPIIPDLLFLHSTKEELDKIISRTGTLQYRYNIGHSINEPMVVRDKDMELFIDTVNKADNIRYYLPEEIKADMYGKEISVVGGPLDGYTGKLLSLRGSKKRRIIVEIPGFITAAVEVHPEYIQFTK